MRLVETKQRKLYPLISVLIPSYQSGNPLLDAVRSVLNQDYENLELIVCDDGTKGFSREAVLAYAETYNAAVDISVICQPENLGTVKNLNAGLQAARGEWILLLAADDALASCGAVSSLMKQAAASGRQWILSSTMLCDEQLRETGQTVPPADIERLIREGNAAELYWRLCLDCCFPASGTMYRKELLEENSAFDERYRLVEDWPMFLKLLRQGILPEISTEKLILHRGGGVSRKRAAGNRRYQQDLITVMQEEILPHLRCLEESQRAEVYQRVCDKQAVFQYRFLCEKAGQRLAWLFRNPGVIFRRITRRCP